jgi:hypothetical protein
MKATTLLCTAVCALLFSGCGANRMGVTPSQNSSLGAVSPSTTAASKGGVMQHSLDSWLKEEWAPMTISAPVITTKTASDGTVVTTKTEVTQIVTTTTAPDGTVVTTTAPVAPEPEDETPFTLQKYADKWKIYNDNKAKMNEGKPKETSHVESMQNMPAIGK